MPKEPRVPAEDVIPSPIERVKSFLVVAGTLLIGLPLCDGVTRWPVGPPRTLAVALLVAIGVCYGLAKRFPARLHARDVFLLVFVPLYVIYTGNGDRFGAGDTLGTREIPLRLVAHGTLDLSGASYLQQEPSHYSAVRVHGRMLPSFPLGTGLLAVPQAAVALALTPSPVGRGLVSRFEKHFAAIATALAAVFLFLATRRFYGDLPALFLAAIFGLGTTMFSTGSQAMWSITGEVLLLCLMLILLASASADTRQVIAAGLVLGGAFLCRPTALIPGAAAFVVLLRQSRRHALLFGLSSGVSVLASMVWLRHLYGHPLGGYGLMNGRAHMWSRSPWVGLAGVLLSPSRGLLVYCPFVLFIFLGVLVVRRDAAIRPWWLLSAGTVIGVLALTSAYAKWWGGMSQGPRLLSETCPFLAILLLPALARWRELRRVRPLFLAAVLFSIATQFLLAYGTGASVWEDRADTDANPSMLWWIRDGQLAAAWGVPPSSRAIRLAFAKPSSDGSQGDGDASLTGSLDGPAPESQVQGELIVRGWARIPGETLTVTFELDQQPREPLEFRRVSRPDVCTVIPALSPCTDAGFEARFAFLPDDAGPHDLVALFHSKAGRTRHYPHRHIEWHSGSPAR